MELDIKLLAEFQPTRGDSPSSSTKATHLLRNTSLKTNKPNRKYVVDGWEPGKDPKVNYSGHFEFCGSWGTGLMIVGFPLLMYYMWIGATFNGGHFPVPTSTQSFVRFGRHLAELVYQHAFPSLRAWRIYWMFFPVETAFYCYLPGVQAYGKPPEHEGARQLRYHCSPSGPFTSPSYSPHYCISWGSSNCLQSLTNSDRYSPSPSSQGFWSLFQRTSRPGLAMLSTE
jgi:hypothetical protein